MNAIVPQNFGPLSTKFASVPKEDDLSAGVQQGFGILGYKGKVWSLRYRGNDTPLMREDGDGPRNSVELVILKASQHVSKIWYEHGYQEGSSAAPDCFSTNGTTPDMGSKKKQANVCAACPRNAWGSRITPEGKQGKECSDSKRLAVVPLGDIKNEIYGGALLLRVPAASLREVAGYGEKMQALGYPYYAIGTRIAFDAGEAYPKFVFNAIRPLTDAEAVAVIEMRESPAVARLLAEGSENASQAPVTPAAVASAFEQPPAVAAPAVAAPQTAPQAPQQVAQQQPVQQTVTQPVAQPQTAGAFGGADVGRPAPTVQPAQPTQAASGTAVNNPDFEAMLDEKLSGLLADA